MDSLYGRGVARIRTGATAAGCASKGAAQVLTMAIAASAPIPARVAKTMTAIQPPVVCPRCGAASRRYASYVLSVIRAILPDVGA